MSRASVHLALFLLLLSSSVFAANTCVTIFDHSKEITPIDKIAQAWGSKGRVRFFVYGKGEKELGPGVLIPGKGYTVAVIDTENPIVFIGEDYTGGQPGSATKGAHPVLAVDAGGNTWSYQGTGGALKVLNDGTIVVSGFHMQYVSQPAADYLAELLKTALESAGVYNVKVIALGDRLSTFDPGRLVQ